MSGTSMVTNAPAVRTCQSWPREPTSSLSWIVSTATSSPVTKEDERHQEVVPDPEKLEDGEGRQCRNRQREHEPNESCEVRGAIDIRRLEQVLGKLGDVVVQQIYRERQPETCMRQPNPKKRPGKTKLHVAPQQGNQGHLQRNHQKADDDHEQHRPARELHPGKGIGSERSHSDRYHCRRNGDDEAIHKGIEHALVGEHVRIVGNRPCLHERIGQDRPPP